MATRLGQHPATVSTVEHFLSAVSALGIDNLVVDVNRPELPIMDGSASPFIFLMQSAGLRANLTEKVYSNSETHRGSSSGQIRPAATL